MAKLIAKSPTEGLLPVRHGTLTLRDSAMTRLTAVAPYPGRTGQVGAALRKLGLDWPAPDRALSNGRNAVLWSGRDQAFLLNAAPEGIGADMAAITDITDGWAALTVEGRAGAAALARLVPLDLSPRAFPEGATARTGLGHMQVLLHRRAGDKFTLYVFRSMVATAIHEIEGTMKALAARALI